MKAKPTGNPVHDSRIGFHVVNCSPHDLQNKLCSIHDVAIGIQRFTLILQPMELVLRVKLGTES